MFGGLRNGKNNILLYFRIKNRESEGGEGVIVRIDKKNIEMSLNDKN